MVLQNPSNLIQSTLIHKPAPAESNQVIIIFNVKYFTVAAHTHLIAE